MDKLQGIGDPELRRALLFVRSAPAPVTIDELAEALGVHRNVARSRLDRLVESGLLETQFERRTGRTGPGAGRPAKTYSVSPEVAAIEFPLRRYESLVRLLISALPNQGRTRALREVGVAFGEELGQSAAIARVRTLPEAVARICGALGQLGFHAAVESAGKDEAWIQTAICPLRPLVVADRSAIAVDNGMWAGLVHAALDRRGGVEVECEGHDCLDEHAACRVRIRLRETALPSESHELVP